MKVVHIIVTNLNFEATSFMTFWETVKIIIKTLQILFLKDLFSILGNEVANYIDISQTMLTRSLQKEAI